MVNLTVSNPKILDTFLIKFRHHFSKPVFRSFSFYVAGLFLLYKRASIQSISLYSPAAKYENMQYFLSEAQWDPDELNSHRIHIIESNRTTKSSIRGVAIIDDTGAKKTGFHTEGAQVQYFPTDKSKTRCNIVVTSAYSDHHKRFPVNFRPYIPEKDLFFQNNPETPFKSKIQLAIELIQDLIDKKISFSDIVFDSWYFAASVVEFIEDLYLTFITEATSDRLVSFKGKWLHAGELVKFIPLNKLKAVTAINSKKETKPFLTYSFVSKIKGIDSPVKIVVAFGKWNEEDPKDVHVFVTNHLAYSAFQVITKYALRWSIEWIFRDLKENVYFDHYQVRSIKAISRHWHLSALAYSFLYWSKFNGYLSKNFVFQSKPKTMGKQLQLFRNINSITSADWITQNYQTYQNFLGIKISSRRAA